MTGPLDLDHVGLVVADLDAARRAYERLGFRLTPLSSHQGPLEPGGPVEPWGSGNHCAMFRRGYLELLGITDPTRHHAHIRERLDRYQGLHLVALGCADADAVHARWARSVANLRPVAEIGRDVPQVSGGTRPARFRIVYLDGYVPEVMLFAIQHVDRAALWQSTLLSHPNGVMALRGATVTCTDPRAVAERLAAIELEAKPVPDGWRVTLARGGTLDIVHETEAARRFPGETPPSLPSVMAAEYQVSDLAATASFLEAAEVPFDALERRIRVSARHGQGSVVDFTTLDAEEASP